MENETYEALFQPIQIGRVTLKNRYALAPMLFVHDYEEGAFGDRAIAYYLERAKGGAGLLFTSLCKVDNAIEQVDLGMPMPNQNPALFTERLKELTDQIARYDSKLFVQLTAGFGRAIFPQVAVSQKSYVAPSPISNRWNPTQNQRELSRAEIHTIIKQFGKAAKVAQEGGAAGIEIHALHEGYLLDQFSIAFYNHRTDEYGGGLENRLRFAKEIIDEIHDACGADYPVGMRLSLKSFVKDLRKGILPDEKAKEQGRDLAEGLEVAQLLETYGYAHLSVDGGNYDAWYWAHPPLFFDRGPYLPLAEQVKKCVHIPVIVSGMLADPKLAQEALLSHKLDMVALGRPLIADSQLVNKIHTGNFLEATPCQYCHEGCFNQVNSRRTHCTVNARAGREDLYPLESEKTSHPQRIAIIGAGPAGLESARLLAQKGHQVSIYEKAGQIGGLFYYGVVPDFKSEGVALIDWWRRQLSQLGVRIELNTPISEMDERLQKADVILTATGSIDFIPQIAGVHLPQVHTAKEALSQDPKSLSEVVTIIGGGTVGVELAIWLSKHAKKVQIIEMAEKMLPKGAPLPNMQMMLELLDFYHVTCYTQTKLNRITETTIEAEKNGEAFVLPASDIILALGYRPENSLYKKLSQRYVGSKVINIGDSDHVQDVLEAVGEALDVSQRL